MIGRIDIVQTELEHFQRYLAHRISVVDKGPLHLYNPEEEQKNPVLQIVGCSLFGDSFEQCVDKLCVYRDWIMFTQRH